MTKCKHCGADIALRPVGFGGSEVWCHQYTSGQWGRRDCSTKLAEPEPESEMAVLAGSSTHTVILPTTSRTPGERMTVITCSVTGDVTCVYEWRLYLTPEQCNDTNRELWNEGRFVEISRTGG